MNIIENNQLGGDTLQNNPKAVSLAQAQATNIN